MNFEWQNKTILIVEDDYTSNEFFREVLSLTGARIKFAINSKEALEIFKNEKIDIVLLDIQLPGISGIEILKEIKKINNKIPVIAETAYALTGDREKYISLGFDDYIAKPILPVQLLEIISNYI